jgi:TRAP-type C4-dicarboxylate transport system permease small subunit
MRRLIAIAEAAGVMALGLITVFVVYDVVARAAGHPTLWVLEVSGYLMVAASMLGAGEVMYRGGHFQVRLFADMLPHPLQAAFDRFIAVVTATFVIAITFGCVQLILETQALGFKSPTLLQVPLVVPQSVLCAGLAVLAAAAVLRVTWQRRERSGDISVEDSKT